MIISDSNSNNYWSGKPVATEQIKSWIEAFHRDGFMVLENFLSSNEVLTLKNEMEEAFAKHKDHTGGVVELRTKMFEVSPANLRLFNLEPLVSFAENLVAKDCHVIHNNSFQTPKGGGITTWHQDDAPHFITTSGEPPTNIQLPVLLFTANFYLTDVTSIEHGPTQFIPGSHLFGASPPGDMSGTKWESRIQNCYGRAGTVIMFNNQVWHRGAPNSSERTRFVTQVSYARRIIGHKYFPFMNYQMPEHVYRDADPRLRRLLGFLPTGAYG